MVQVCPSKWSTTSTLHSPAPPIPVGVSAMTGGVPSGYDHTAPMLTEDDLVNGCVMGPHGGSVTPTVI